MSHGEPFSQADQAWMARALELARRGVSLSGIRPGRKPGSLVATVKSHCLGIPTLFLQPG